jgi:hypothetical protein
MIQNFAELDWSMTRNRECRWEALMRNAMLRAPDGEDAGRGAAPKMQSIRPSARNACAMTFVG